jgi:hypothetical protein
VKVNCEPRIGPCPACNACRRLWDSGLCGACHTQGRAAAEALSEWVRRLQRGLNRRESDGGDDEGRADLEAAAGRLAEALPPVRRLLDATAAEEWAGERDWGPCW